MVESDSENTNSSSSNDSSSGSSSNSRESVKSVKVKEAEPQKDGKSAAKFKSRWDQRNEFTQSQPVVKKDDCELDKTNNEKNSESSKLILMNEKHARGEYSANATRTPLNDSESKVNPREGDAKIQDEHEAKTKEACEEHHNNAKAINVNKLSSSSINVSKEVENSEKNKNIDESVGKFITRSRSRSSDRDDATAKKRDNNSRRSRSPKTKRDRSKSNSFERRSKKQRERERSHSEESKLRRSKRSESLERRREERRKRHAEREDRGRPNKRSVSKERQISSNAAVGDKTKDDVADKMTERQRRTVDLLTSRTGGAYIPPAKLRLMQAEITDKSSIAYQRLAWEALKKSIHGYINKVNVDNIAIITRELLKENIVRGRGLLCRSIIQAQAASPTFTHVYAALVAIINSKFPKIGELLLKRLVIQFKRAFRRNDKNVCLSSTRFIAHIVNQRVAHEILALEILTLLVEMPTDDSVEVAIAFLKECGMKLTEVSSKGTGAIFEMLKNILHEGKLDKRVQYMIEVVFQVRKDGFKDHQSVIESLELVEENDQFTHLLTLDEATDPEESLNAFKFDENFETNEDKYKGLSREILGSDASASDGSSSSAGSASDSDGASDSDDEADKPATSGDIIDNTETNLIALRRTIYLTINSSLDYEECAHKLMKMQLKPGQEIELCHMFLDCCAEQRTYEKFYGLLAQRFCAINKIYIEPFEEIFKDTYQTTHRLDTNRLRNVSKFFAHLLFTDAIGWDVLECIKLNEDDTTSSSRIFIKILFQELAEYMGLSQLNRKLKDEALIESLAGVFPKDNPRNTRFSINFFTSIGLGGLTDELRQFLKNAPKSVPAINAEILANKPVKVTTESSSSTSASSSSTTSSSSSSGSSSSSSSSDSSNSSSSESSTDSNSDSILKKVKGKRNKKQRKNSNIKNKKHKTKKSKKKENKKSKKNRKRQKKHRQESSSSSSESESISDSMSSSSNSSRSGESRSKGKTRKTTEAKTSAKPVKRLDEKDKHQKDIKRRRQQDENGYDEKVDENCVEQRERELVRRREERERRHRERDQQEECKQVRQRSELERSPGDRERRHNRDRHRDPDRYEERRRQDERERTRSRSRDHRKRETYAKKQHEYERSRIRTTSKERG
uniref:MI domain-containing protein n=1 Tax=Glossina austeni TaxID=7395 RepID=A0A1A9VUY5_GLOAU